MDVQCEVLINAKLEEVVNAFMSYESLTKWQKNLVRIVPLKDVNSYLLVYDSDGQEFAMKMSLKGENLPDSVTHVYEVPGAKNERTDYFSEQDGMIAWVVDASFEFDKSVQIPEKLLSEKIISDMQQFKDYIEKH